MNEQEKVQFVSLGKQVRDKELIEMFKGMKSKDATDADYSIANVLTIAEVISAIERHAHGSEE